MGPSARASGNTRGRERASVDERSGVMKFLGRIYGLAERERGGEREREQWEREHKQLE